VWRSEVCGEAFIAQDGRTVDAVQGDGAPCTGSPLGSRAVGERLWRGLGFSDGAERGNETESKRGPPGRGCSTVASSRLRSQAGRVVTLANWRQRSRSIPHARTSRDGRCEGVGLGVLRCYVHGDKERRDGAGAPGGARVCALCWPGSGVLCARLSGWAGTAWFHCSAHAAGCCRGDCVRAEHLQLLSCAEEGSRLVGSTGSGQKRKDCTSHGWVRTGFSLITWHGHLLLPLNFLAKNVKNSGCKDVMI
jgi:hypothetical protein